MSSLYNLTKPRILKDLKKYIYQCPGSLHHQRDSESINLGFVLSPSIILIAARIESHYAMLSSVTLGLYIRIT